MRVDVASGALHGAIDDISLPGKVALVWDRRYQSLGHERGSHFGPGWSSRYDVTLTRSTSGLVLAGPGTTVEAMHDPHGLVDYGQIVRSLGAFLEVVRRGEYYVVQRWDVETGDVSRFVFARGPLDVPLPLLRVEDATGQGLDLMRDGRGRLAAISQPLERRVLQLEYERAGLVARATLWGPDGRSHALTRYEYDDAGRMAAAFDAAGSTTRYEYDSRGRLAREVAKDGGVFTFRYDARDRCVRASGLDRYDEKTIRYLDAVACTEVTDSYGATTRYFYQSSGQVYRVVDPLGGDAWTEYDEYSRIVARTDANGARTTYEFDEHGNRAAATDPVGRTRRYVFNDQHLPEVLIAPSGATWRRRYDAANRVVSIEDPLAHRWAIRYDAFGNATEIENPNGDRKTQRYVDGLLREVVDWDGGVATYEFDALGRVVRRSGPAGDAVDLRYDAGGNITTVALPTGATIQAEYDGAGNVRRVTDEAGRVTTYRFGPCRRLLERTDAAGGTIRFEWGTEPDRLDGIVNELGEAHTFARDAAGRIVHETSFDGRAQDFRYDAAGRCVAVTNGAGEVIELARDAAGRLSRQLLPDGVSIRYAYDAWGCLRQVENQHGAVTFVRDVMGRLVREIQGDAWVDTEYDAVGNVIRTVSSTGHAIDFGRDAAGRVARVSGSDGQSVEYLRDANGREVTRLMPGGARLDQTYDVIGYLLTQAVDVRGREHGRSAAAAPPGWGERLVDRTYAYDAGRLVAVNDRRWGRTRYSYDPVERLTGVERAGAPREAFRYDAAGNLAEQESVRGGARQSVFTYGGGNRLVRKGDTEFVYDAQGRLTTRTERRDEAPPRTWRYTWNALDQLCSVVKPDGEVWTYEYDGLGRRTSKSGRGRTSRFVWDRDVVLHDGSDGQDGTGWVFEPGTFVPLAQLRRGRLYPVVTDQLGTPREVFGPTGALAWAADYLAWGEVETTAVRHVECPVRFQGQWYDEESGLHYNRFRYYDPTTARYISADPLGPTAALNMFAYTPNPVTWVDPYGLAAVCEKKLQEAVDHAVETIPGLSREQAEVILRGAFSRGSSAVFGGSRVRGNFHDGSDLDVGFGSLSASQAGKVLDKAAAVPGGLPVEQTKIVPGNTPPNIPTIKSPEDFFMSSGTRSGGDPRAGQPYTPSGYTSYGPDGSITQCTPDGTVTPVKGPS